MYWAGQSPTMACCTGYTLLLAPLAACSVLHSGCVCVPWQSNGRQLGVQVLAAVVMTVWCFFWGFASMFVLKRLSLLKVSKETELGGVDLFKHDVAAYPEFVSVCVSV